jgi:hypothetical protein
MTHKQTLLFHIFSLIYFISPFILLSSESAEKDSIKIPYNIDNRNILFVFRGHTFIIPAENYMIDKFLKHSVLYTPQDIVRDGLPWYGAKRDDWIEGKKIRKHLGIDIYDDSLVVVAPESGIIEIAGRNRISGGWIKINHGSNIKSVLIHLSEMYVKKGVEVNQGQVIAKIKKPEGNAVNTQLHFSLQIDGKKWDPIYFIKITYNDIKEVMALINEYEKRKNEIEKIRDEKVREYKIIKRRDK